MSGNNNQKSILNYFRQKSVRKTDYATPSILSQGTSDTSINVFNGFENLSYLRIK